jgi:hypothetical protein
MSMTTPKLSAYHCRLKDFQLGVANKWIEVAASEHASVFQFVACFAAFNALYWLWGEVDGLPKKAEPDFTKAEIDSAVADLSNIRLQARVRKTLSRRRPPGERGQIRNLVSKLDPAILDRERVKACIKHLHARGPIRDMRSRSQGQEEGDKKEGDKQLTLLGDQNPGERLQALAQILYMVRCNLVHGSKEVFIDVKLLTFCVPLLRALAEGAIVVTQTESIVS